MTIGRSLRASMRLVYATDNRHFHSFLRHWNHSCWALVARFVFAYLVTGKLSFLLTGNGGKVARPPSMRLANTNSWIKLHGTFSSGNVTSPRARALFADPRNYYIQVCSRHNKTFKLTLFCRFWDWLSRQTIAALESSTSQCNLPHNSEYAIINVRRSFFPPR